MDGWLYTAEVRLAFRSPGLDYAYRLQIKIRDAMREAATAVVEAEPTATLISFTAENPRSDPSNFSGWTI